MALYPEQDFPTANKILATPDEVLRQVGLVSEHYQRLSTLQETEVIATRYRMKRSDGEWCWICSLAPPAQHSTRLSSPNFRGGSSHHTV
ncbi:MAG: hypothetical protein IGR76_04995 [Synechococcales cyanobacterium T60_A2020_003]|nr:hypothetical protein [Synechococcales cyanobacterium T60_A2020_003]